MEPAPWPRLAMADIASLARFQRVIDVVRPRLGGGCHASRATLEAIGAAGFEVERVRRFRFRPEQRSTSTILS